MRFFFRYVVDCFMHPEIEAERAILRRVIRSFPNSRCVISPNGASAIAPRLVYESNGRVFNFKNMNLFVMSFESEFDLLSFCVVSRDFVETYKIAIYDTGFLNLLISDMRSRTLLPDGIRYSICKEFDTLGEKRYDVEKIEESISRREKRVYKQS